MPIVVACPKCPTKLSAPDSAAGKAVRCPKCGAAAPVPNLLPAEEVPVVEATVAPPKPKPKPVLAEAEDDRPRKKSRRDEEDADDEPPRKKKKRYEDDDDDDPPPRRKRRKAGGGGGGALVAILVIGGLFLAGLVGLGIYFFTGKDSVFARKTPVPPGWKLYENASVGVKGYFPTEPTAFGGKIEGGFGGPMPGGIEVPQIESMLGLTTGGGFNQNQVTVTVDVMRYRTSLPRSARDAVRNVGNQQFGGAEVRKVRWLGGDAAEMSTGGMLMRVVYTDKVVVVVQISGPNGARAKPEEEAAFFDNFELTK